MAENAQLSRRVPGVVTVLFHSLVWLYFSGPQQDRARSLLAEAAEKATSRAPFAWLRMERSESGSPSFDVHPTVWPSGETKLIARADPLGQMVEAKLFDS
jgi:hypothetical protein